ncbi:SDR family oxidoreductase [Rhizobium sp. CG4]|jgi:3-oxoacyl-[acyl-carrier protein] reductase|uniref:SDR family NAD(P)-dependent oxidoreductase n=1 Tax=unclassified Rhizobium TaxID=2613769 RepID=UPI002168D5C7|nr:MULTISPECIES: SDR family oxidoreductase [unclassified Rhizobium]MCM2456441.1 SDR family oxidoreductase [Rhizobium sp. CG4]MCS4244032.1 3-oxoacyl-[acyl-carrier protein] reductase [Rhizobium sp. BIGb0125]
MPDTYATFADNCFAGRSVLITGAASGMGLETARAFASKGAEVVMADRDEAGLERYSADLRQSGAKIHTVRVDVSDQASIAAAFEYCDTNLQRLDNVVTCAAIITAKRIFEQDWAHWRRVLDVNLLGTFFTVQAAVKRMLDNPEGGNIVCTASDAGVHGGGGLIADTPYAASKAATLSMVKSVARELAGKKIRINALNPGPTDSPMHSHIDPALKERIAANLPMRRMGRPDDMAAAIMFLCSNAASFTYGSALDVDGGSMFR